MEERKEHLIREAINNGISSDSICDTLSKMFGSKSLNKYTSRQIKLVIKSICDMKNNKLSNINSSYYSELIKNNYDKIVDALKNGISSKEVTIGLINSVNDKNISIDDFKYLISMIANLKKKDLIKTKNAFDYQKQLTN